MSVARPRLIFMGTPELARTVLSALAEQGRWEIPLVVAQPDKPVGRGMRLQASPVKQEAEARGIPVLQPRRARDPGFLEALVAASPDVVVVAAYGQLLPASVLEVPRRGCINVHTSILPRWRGAAPIAWSILEGDAETGVTLMRMDAGLDTGEVIAVEKTVIGPEDTGASLHDRLATLGAKLICRVLPDWVDGRLASVPQPESGVTYARKLAKDDGRLDWSRPVAELERRIRALNPWPGAFTTVPGAGEAPELLKIWEARPCAVEGSEPAAPGEVRVARGEELVIAAGDGSSGLRVTGLQREGRRRMTAREFLAGGGLRPGMRLGS